MIRSSIWNLTQEGINLLANYFVEQEGNLAFPLLNSDNSQRGNSDGILCPEA